MTGTARAKAAKRDFGVGNRRVRRDFPGFRKSGLQRNVGHRAAFIAEEMTVRCRVLAIPGGGAVEIDVLDEPRLRQRLQAIIDRGERNGRDLGFDAHENVLRRRVIGPLHEGLVDVAALLGVANPAPRNQFVEILRVWPRARILRGRRGRRRSFRVLGWRLHGVGWGQPISRCAAA